MLSKISLYLLKLFKKNFSFANILTSLIPTNVSDIVQVVNYILGGGTAKADCATEAKIVIANNTLSIRANGVVQGVQLTLTHDSNFSIDLEDLFDPNKVKLNEDASFSDMFKQLMKNIKYGEQQL